MGRLRRDYWPVHRSVPSTTCLLGACLFTIIVIYFFARGSTLAVTRGLRVRVCLLSSESIFPESTFADSVPDGNRTQVFALKHALILVAAAFSPLISIVMFHYFGNEWKIATLRVVLLSGVGLLVVPTIVQFFFSDDSSLSAPTAVTTGTTATSTCGDLGTTLIDPSSSTEANISSTTQPPPQEQQAGSRIDSPFFSHVLVPADGVVDTSLLLDPTVLVAPTSPRMMPRSPRFARVTMRPASPTWAGAATTRDEVSSSYSALPSFPQEGNDQDPQAGAGTKVLDAEAARLARNKRYIPRILSLIDFLIALGAGMTIKYFALYFLNDFGLSPVVVSLLYLITPLVTAMVTLIVAALAKRIGRVPAALLAYCVGTGCLVALVFLDNVYIVLPVYCLRTAAMNAVRPIDRSIMMDVVPPETRGFWNAIESIFSFSWSGSAVIGGWLSDYRGYRFCFGITASLYGFCCLLYLFLLPIVPPETPAATTENDADPPPVKLALSLNVSSPVRTRTQRGLSAVVQTPTAPQEAAPAFF